MDWKEEFSAGIAQLDREHQRLVQCVTDIEIALSKGEPPVVVHAALERLVVSVRVHFSDEEGLMRKMKYPHTPAHLKEHHDLLTDLEAIEVSSPQTPISSETVDLLQRTLEKHFSSDEKDYGVFVLSRSGSHFS